MNAVTDMVLNSARKPPLQTRPAGRLPASIPAGAAVWVERRRPAAASPRSQGSKRVCPEVGSPSSLDRCGETAAFLGVRFAAAGCSGCSHAWGRPPPRSVVLHKGVGCPGAVLGVPCPLGARVLVALRHRVGQGWPSCAGQGEPSP